MRVSKDLEDRILGTPGVRVAAFRPQVEPETPAEARKSEKAFQSEVIKEAKKAGWRHYHVYDSRRTVPGFPDLVLCRAIPRYNSGVGRVIFAELKLDNEEPTPAQEEWLADLRSTGCVEVYVWKPKDWPDILRILE